MFLDATAAAVEDKAVIPAAVDDGAVIPAAADDEAVIPAAVEAKGGITSTTGQEEPVIQNVEDSTVQNGDVSFEEGSSAEPQLKSANAEELSAEVKTVSADSEA